MHPERLRQAGCSCLSISYVKKNKGVRKKAIKYQSTKSADADRNAPGILTAVRPLRAALAASFDWYIRRRSHMLRKASRKTSPQKTRGQANHWKSS
jgi:hypothetical protein